jgi:hypothetical protein
MTEGARRPRSTNRVLPAARCTSARVPMSTVAKRQDANAHQTMRHHPDNRLYKNCHNICCTCKLPISVITASSLRGHWLQITVLISLLSSHSQFELCDKL